MREYQLDISILIDYFEELSTTRDPEILFFILELTNQRPEISFLQELKKIYLQFFSEMKSEELVKYWTYIARNEDRNESESSGFEFFLEHTRILNCEEIAQIPGSFAFHFYELRFLALDALRNYESSCSLQDLLFQAIIWKNLILVKELLKWELGLSEDQKLTFVKLALEQQSYEIVKSLLSVLSREEIVAFFQKNLHFVSQLLLNRQYLLFEDLLEQGVPCLSVLHELVHRHRERKDLLEYLISICGK